jgi:hypothetical protein
MKKLFLNLFVLTALVFATSCSSDDDSGNGSGDEPQELKATVDGNVVTINSVEVIQGTSTDMDVIAKNDAINTEFRFGLGVGLTGEDTIFNISYKKDNVEYWTEGSYSSFVIVNNGSRVEFTFSGTLQGYNSVTEETIYVTIENGSLYADY